jgi:hypothetical protein
MQVCRYLGIRPYPQRFVPLSSTSRAKPHVAKAWNEIQLKAFHNYWVQPKFFNTLSFTEYVRVRHNKEQGNKKWRCSEEDLAAFGSQINISDSYRDARVRLGLQKPKEKK